MRIERVGNTQLRIEITRKEASYDWFGSLLMGLRAGVAELHEGMALSDFEIEAAQEFVKALEER